MMLPACCKHQSPPRMAGMNTTARAWHLLPLLPVPTLTANLQAGNGLQGLCVRREAWYRGALQLCRSIRRLTCLLKDLPRSECQSSAGTD